MAEYEKEHGIMDIIKDGISHISHILAAGIVSPIAMGSDIVMKNIEDRIMLIEKRILKKISNLFIIGFGGIFLIFALLFFLVEFVHWSMAAAYFSIGIIIFVIGLLLKVGESDK
jgi:hypothetical protein